MGAGGGQIRKKKTKQNKQQKLQEYLKKKTQQGNKVFS